MHEDNGFLNIIVIMISLLYRFINDDPYQEENFIRYIFSFSINGEQLLSYCRIVIFSAIIARSYHHFYATWFSEYFYTSMSVNFSNQQDENDYFIFPNQHNFMQQR